MQKDPKVIAVLSKDDRDPFKYYQPPWWKKPFYEIEDAFESILEMSQMAVDMSRAAKLPAGISPLGLAYGIFAALVLLFVALFVSRQMTIF
jgi:hypothetical protein